MIDEDEIIDTDLSIESEMRKVLGLTAVTNVTTVENPSTHSTWSGSPEATQSRIDFFRKLRSLWLEGNPVADKAKKVHLPKKTLPPSLFHISLMKTRENKKFNPNIGTFFGLEKNECVLYLSPPTCEFEIRISKGTAPDELFEWFKHDYKDEFCAGLNSKLEYNEKVEKRITFIPKITNGTDRNQIKLTSKFLKDLQGRFTSTNKIPIPPKCLWVDYMNTINEITPHFEDAVYEAGKQFLQDTSNNQDH